MLLEETEENIQYNEVPSSSSNRISNGLNIKSFKYEWLTKFNWLIYDNEKKVMFCKICKIHNKANTFANSIVKC
jgi:hypothetical protein